MKKKVAIERYTTIIPNSKKWVTVCCNIIFVCQSQIIKHAFDCAIPGQVSCQKNSLYLLKSFLTIFYELRNLID
jgi:hypothetical protein